MAEKELFFGTGRKIAIVKPDRKDLQTGIPFIPTL